MEGEILKFPLDQRLSIYVDWPTMQALKAVTRKRRVTLSALVRQTLFTGLAEFPEFQTILEELSHASPNP